MTAATNPETGRTAVTDAGGDVTIHLTRAALPRIAGLDMWARIALGHLSNIAAGRYRIVLPDGRTIVAEGAEPGPEGTILIRDPRLWRRVVLGGDIGLAEAYIDGWWDSPDLAAVIEVGARNMAAFGMKFAGSPLHKAMRRVGHLLRPNSRAGSRKNIMAHYDLGNSFYQAWLDDTMTYSSALFRAGDEPLPQAQRNKYAAIAEAMNLNPGQKVLEIGAGWGGFAEFAAGEVGAHVTGITISPSQYDFAKKRIFEKGLAEKVEIRLQDYREVEGRFDRIASIEMFEAVGERYWPQFFGKVRDCLAPGGHAALQIITIREEFYDSYRSGADFIQRYIFPGGMLPSPTALKEEVAKAGLAWRGAVEFGQDYARTLGLWHRQFLEAWPSLTSQGFDDRFRRLWQYYLCYCEGGFRAGNIDVAQISLAKS